jgi:hypothetical protein
MLLVERFEVMEEFLFHECFCFAQKPIEPRFLSYLAILHFRRTGTSANFWTLGTGTLLQHLLLRCTISPFVEPFYCFTLSGQFL